jgi:hypothetical protein
MSTLVEGIGRPDHHEPIAALQREVGVRGRHRVVAPPHRQHTKSALIFKVQIPERPLRSRTFVSESDRAGMDVLIVEPLQKQVRPVVRVPASLKSNWEGVEPND